MSRTLRVVTRYTAQQEYDVPWPHDREPTHLEVMDMIAGDRLDADDVITDGAESLYGEDLHTFYVLEPQDPERSKDPKQPTRPRPAP